MNKDYVVGLIESMQAEKDASKTKPNYILDVDLFNRAISDLKKMVNELVKEGIVGFDRTINNTAFFINKNKNE